MANPNTLYRVVSAQNQAKALTIDKVTNKLSVSTYNNDPNQKFNIYTEANKYALVLSSNQWGLCIYMDKK